MLNGGGLENKLKWRLKKKKRFWSWKKIMAIVIANIVTHLIPLFMSCAIIIMLFSGVIGTRRTKNKEEERHHNSVSTACTCGCRLIAVPTINADGSMGDYNTGNFQGTADLSAGSMTSQIFNYIQLLTEHFGIDFRFSSLFGTLWWEDTKGSGGNLDALFISEYSTGSIYTSPMTFEKNARYVTDGIEYKGDGHGINPFTVTEIISVPMDGGTEKVNDAVSPFQVKPAYISSHVGDSREFVSSIGKERPDISPIRIGDTTYNISPFYLPDMLYQYVQNRAGVTADFVGKLDTAFSSGAKYSSEGGCVPAIWGELSPNAKSYVGAMLDHARYNGGYWERLSEKELELYCKIADTMDKDAARIYAITDDCFRGYPVYSGTSVGSDGWNNYIVPLLNAIGEGSNIDTWENVRNSTKSSVIWAYPIGCLLVGMGHFEQAVGCEPGQSKGLLSSYRGVTSENPDITVTNVSQLQHSANRMWACSCPTPCLKCECHDGGTAPVISGNGVAQAGIVNMGNPGQASGLFATNEEYMQYIATGELRGYSADVMTQYMSYFGPPTGYPDGMRNYSITDASDRKYMGPGGDKFAGPDGIGIISYNQSGNVQAKKCAGDTFPGQDGRSITLCTRWDEYEKQWVPKSLATGGCGWFSTSMIISTLTKTAVSPFEVVVALATINHWSGTDYGSTAASNYPASIADLADIMYEAGLTVKTPLGAPQLNLPKENCGVGWSKAELDRTLDANGLVLVVVGGDKDGDGSDDGARPLTTGSHYIVIRDRLENGNYVVWSSTNGDGGTGKYNKTPYEYTYEGLTAMKKSNTQHLYVTPA